MQDRRRLLLLDNRLRELSHVPGPESELPSRLVALIQAMTLKPVRQFRPGSPHSQVRTGIALKSSNNLGHHAPLAARVPLVPRDARDGAAHSNLLRTTCLSTRPTETKNRRLNRPAVAGQPLGEGAAPSMSRRLKPTTDISI
jgi:hypothetical protein